MSHHVDSFVCVCVCVCVCVQGDISDHNSLVKAIKEVDVVISTVGARQLADQVKIIAAIKEAGTVKASPYG